MRIVLQPHLKIRLQQRKIPPNYPRKILNKSESKYFDNLTGHFIAVRNLEYNEKLRPMVVAYDIIGREIQVVTIHPEDDQEIQNRLKSGRWIKYEES